MKPSGYLAGLIVVLCVAAATGLGFVSAPAVSSEREQTTQSDLTVQEPTRWRGEYVSPAERRGKLKQDPDPYAPDNNPELWARLVVVDDKGRPMFPPQALHDSMKVRYADRDPMLDLGIDIWNGMHPQPIMTVNRKVYSVTLEENGWRTSAVVYANVAQREYEKEWFDALQGQTVTLYREPGYPAGVSNYETLEVEKATFGKVQTMVVQENGNIAYSMDYEGRLTIRETLGSFLQRQLDGVLKNLFLVFATAIATVVVTALLGALRSRFKRPS